MIKLLGVWKNKKSKTISVSGSLIDIELINLSAYFLLWLWGINSNTSSNITYKPTSFDKDEILANHRSFMTSLNIPSGKESEDLPYLYWIPKLH